MRVICIDSDLVTINYMPMPSKKLVEGDIYTVVNAETEDKVLYYQLAEFPDERHGFKIISYWFEAQYFVPLSETDTHEKDIRRNRAVDKWLKEQCYRDVNSPAASPCP